jgi:hypothetical protein
MIPKLKIYAETLKPLLDWASANPDDKDIKYTITRIIRFSSANPKEHGIPFMYSLGALEAAKSKGIENAEEKLPWIEWKQQTHKGGLRDEGRKNGIFHQEHIVPVSQIAKMLYDLNDITVENIYDVLIENMKIAWILKEEQKILDSINRSGIRTPEELTELNIFIKGFNY